MTTIKLEIDRRSLSRIDRDDKDIIADFVEGALAALMAQGGDMGLHRKASALKQRFKMASDDVDLSPLDLLLIQSGLLIVKPPAQANDLYCQILDLFGVPNE